MGVKVLLKGECPRCHEKKGKDHKTGCQEAQMQMAASQRPKDFNDLSPEVQWAIDKSLGCLDWEGY